MTHFDVSSDGTYIAFIESSYVHILDMNGTYYSTFQHDSISFPSSSLDLTNSKIDFLNNGISVGLVAKLTISSTDYHSFTVFSGGGATTY